MAPEAPQLLLLGLMHFALARLDSWLWKVLKMLLQNSSILTAAAFLPSTTIDWCTWNGQPFSWVGHREGFRRPRPVFHLPSCSRVAFCPAHLCMLTSGCTKRPDALPGHLLEQGWACGVPIPAWELGAWPAQAGSLPPHVVVGG